MSETAGHLAVLKTDVAWNVHHMEKLIVPIPTTVIGDLTAKFLLNLTEKKKPLGKLWGSTERERPPASSSSLAVCRRPSRIFTLFLSVFHSKSQRETARSFPFGDEAQIRFRAAETPPR